MTIMSVSIFTDGASKGNPGPGGWAAVVVDSDNVTELGGREEMTTNNRMELSGAIQGLTHTSSGAEVTIFTDSSYVINGVTKWLHGWKRNGWITKTKQEVLNRDLWEKLDKLVSARSVKWNYVGGHIGIVGNERCDHIATGLAAGMKLNLYKGPLGNYDLPNILDISLDEKKLKNKKSSSSHSKMKAYSYVSAVNGKIETHQTWAECEKRVKGVSGAKFKKAISLQNEGEIIISMSDIDVGHR